MILYGRTAKMNQSLKISDSKIKIARINNEDAIVLDL